MSLKVLIPGALTTVQDLGRMGYQQSGIPCGGVMDRDAYAAANALAGNTAGEAVLEHTIYGGSYLFESDETAVLTGADMKPALDGRPVPMYRPFSVKAGQVLSLGMAENGCRTCLALAGGIDVPVVLGSRSTSIILAKLHTARPAPQRTATRISFHTIQGRSEKEISPREMLRMMATEAWEPELPPVPMSIGIKAVRTVYAASAFSKLVMMRPVKVAESISRSSQGMRRRTSSMTPLRA